MKISWRVALFIARTFPLFVVFFRYCCCRTTFVLFWRCVYVGWPSVLQRGTDSFVVFLLSVRIEYFYADSLILRFSAGGYVHELVLGPRIQSRFSNPIVICIK
jgi:hypothetical protein